MHLTAGEQAESVRLPCSVTDRPLGTDFAVAGLVKIEYEDLRGVEYESDSQPFKAEIRATDREPYAYLTFGPATSRNVAEFAREEARGDSRLTARPPAPVERAGGGRPARRSSLSERRAPPRSDLSRDRYRRRD